MRHGSGSVNLWKSIQHTRWLDCVCPPQCLHVSSVCTRPNGFSVWPLPGVSPYSCGPCSAHWSPGRRRCGTCGLKVTSSHPARGTCPNAHRILKGSPPVPLLLRPSPTTITQHTPSINCLLDSITLAGIIDLLSFFSQAKWRGCVGGVKIIGVQDLDCKNCNSL